MGRNRDIPTGRDIPAWRDRDIPARRDSPMGRNRDIPEGRDRDNATGRDNPIDTGTADRLEMPLVVPVGSTRGARPFDGQRVARTPTSLSHTLHSHQFEESRPSAGSV